MVAAAGAYGIADSRGGSGFIAAFVGGAIYGRIVQAGAPMRPRSPRSWAAC